MNKIIKVNKRKLICRNSLYSVFSSGRVIFVNNSINGQPVFKKRIDYGFKYNLFSIFKILRRVFRLEPKCGLFLNDSEFLISSFGCIYRFSVSEKSLYKEHTFRKEMKNPLYFCHVKNSKSFQNGVYFGEYFSNGNKDEVNIYHRNETGNWGIVYTFKRGEIRHIHNLIYDEYRDAIIVLTGDSDSESKIIIFRNNFKSFETLLSGSQTNRSCFGFALKSGFVFATDTPLEKNSVFYYDFGKNTLEKISNISGPVIYGAFIEGLSLGFFSTSVEPDSRMHGALYNKLGPGVNDHYSHLYCIKKDLTVFEILKFKKDILPMKIFEFGNIQIPTNDLNNDGSIFITGQSLKESRYSTISVSLKDVL